VTCTEKGKVRLLADAACAAGRAPGQGRLRGGRPGRAAGRVRHPLPLPHQRPAAAPPAVRRGSPGAAQAPGAALGRRSAAAHAAGLPSIPGALGARGRAAETSPRMLLKQLEGTADRRQHHQAAAPRRSRQKLHRQPHSPQQRPQHRLPVPLGGRARPARAAAAASAGSRRLETRLTTRPTAVSCSSSSVMCIAARCSTHVSTCARGAQKAKGFCSPFTNCPLARRPRGPRARRACPGAAAAAAPGNTRGPRCGAGAAGGEPARRPGDRRARRPRLG